MNTMGKVTLLGAGPGDLDLLTMKAAKALAAADVLLLDDLVDPGIVALAPRARAMTTLGKLDFAQRMAEPVPHNEQTVVRLIR